MPVMESWSYVSEAKGFVAAEETISSFSSLVKSKNAMLEWELKTPLAFGNSMLVSSQQAIDSQGFGEYTEMMGKQAPNHSVCGGKTVDPTMAIAFSGEDDSTSKLSSSVVDSSSRDFSLIDLKLGRIGDRRDIVNPKFSKGVPGLSSSGSSTPPKRIRLTGVNSQTAFCQVYGCNKDLSSSKDYHKRHKVCELHSKTAKVIVNGIEQRFCQQCSRFHLLAEFDGGKRSCRKRLAGHNERRRKPQVGIHSGRAGRMLQSYSDNRFEGTSSFICQDILPNGFFHPEKYTSDWYRHVKVEDGSDSRPPSIDLCSKLLFPHDAGKQLPSFHETGANAVASTVFGDNPSQYAQELRRQDPGPRSIFFHNTMLGCEDYNGFSTASTIEGFSGTTDSGCALSLLSSQQSQNSSSPLPGIPLARPLMKPSSQTCYSTSQVSEKLIGVSSHASISVVSNKIPSLVMNPMDGHGSHLDGPILMSNSSNAANFGIANGMFQGSDFLNSKDHLSCEDGPTINLLQLSSQLQRVEDQRQSLQMKQDNDAFYRRRIT